jgi:Ca2+-binding RTX toxin-like protein
LDKTGDAVATGSEATFDGLDWLTSQFGIDMNFGDFDGAEGLVAGMLAYIIGYKYAGDNDLTGGAGNDTFYSGMGDDDLRGGSGTDTYVMSMGDGKDTIYETAGGNDVIKFAANRLFSDITMDAANVKANIEGDDLVINYVSGGVSYAKMTIDSFRSTDISQLQLVDAGGSTVATLDMDAIIDGASTSLDPYAMGSSWTVERLDQLAELILIGSPDPIA